jgi:hypothetical protein
MLTTGARVTIPAYAVPAGWPTTGEVVEPGEETTVVELDNGRTQELPNTEITPA